MPAQIPTEQLRSQDWNTRKLLEPLIENVEVLTGQRPGFAPLDALPPGAALGDVITKINAILTRMQG